MGAQKTVFPFTFVCLLEAPHNTTTDTCTENVYLLHIESIEPFATKYLPYQYISHLIAWTS